MPDTQASQIQLNAMRALELATAALTRIERHETECRQRQEDILDKLVEQKLDRTTQNNELKEDIKALRAIIVRTVLAVGGSTVVMLMTVIGWLLATFVIIHPTGQ